MAALLVSTILLSSIDARNIHQRLYRYSERDITETHRNSQYYKPEVHTIGDILSHEEDDDYVSYTNEDNNYQHVDELHSFSAVLREANPMALQESEEDKDEQYKEKKHSDNSQLDVVLLSLVFGIFGVGRLYIGEYYGGSLKLALTLSAIFIGCILPCFSCSSKLCANGTIRRVDVFVTLCVGIFLWWITDVFLFISNDIDDADGLYLDPW